MTIHDTVANLSRDARARLTGLYARHEAGELTWDEFLALGTSVAVTRSQQASSLAVLAVAAELSRLSGRVRAPGTTTAGYDLESTARKSIKKQTSTASFKANGPTSMGIAGAALVMDAYQSTSQRAMRAQGVQLSQRQANSDACPVCLDLNGIIQPVERDSWHHKGCACIQVPVSEDD